MDDLTLKKMQEVLNEASQKIQNIEMQATSKNVSSVYEALFRIQLVYNTISVEIEERGKKDGTDNANPDIQ